MPAEELPEGQVEEPRPLNIHDVANGKAEMPALSDEIVEAGPADDASGTIESLITESIAKSEEPRLVSGLLVNLKPEFRCHRQDQT